MVTPSQHNRRHDLWGKEGLGLIPTFILALLNGLLYLDRHFRQEKPRSTDGGEPLRK